MKPKGRPGKRKGGKFKSDDMLQRFKTSVQGYVERKAGGAETAEQDPRFNFVAKKSRKEMRKEKRKMKKAKMRDHHMKHAVSTAVTEVQQVQNSSLPAGKKQGKGLTGETKKATADNTTSPKEEKKKAKEKKENAHVDSKVLMAQERQQYQLPLNKKNKQSLIDANVDEDKEIKRLEKLLGLNKRRNKQTLPQSFAAEGLDYILGVLDAGAAGMDDSDDEETADKAKDKLKKLENSESDMSEEDDDDDDDDGLDDILEGDSEEDDEEEEEEEQDEEEGDEEEEGGVDIMDYIEEEDEEEESRVDIMDTIVEEDEEEEEEDKDKEGDAMEEDAADESVEEGTRDHPSAEDQSTSDEHNKTASLPSGKYIPPQLRGAMDSKRKAELEKLKKSVKGLVNRLSEANLPSISGQLEELYMTSSRKDMSDTLTDILLAACVTPALMPDRLLMEHILLVSVLHYTVGLEVGAQFLETVVRKFDELYRQQPREGKECDNLVAMVAHLYNFQVVHSLLIFDILKRLLGAFSEKDIELALFLLKTVGFALRKDDPLALKELITEAQRKASDAGAKFKDQTRVRFMLETMMALKNNDMRKIPGYDPEPVEKLRKLQRTLIHRTASGSDVKLRVSLENLLEAEQVGRWWIVGSSWSGAPMIGDSSSKATPQTSTSAGQFSAKVLDLARKQRMNTDIRRNIFCVIMTSEDYLDAFEKLLRLGLKDQQEREIVHVLVDCCLQEKAFNAFYAVLADKFCSHDRRFQMTFQFTLWDKFKELANLSNSTFSNLVQLVSRLLQKKSLSIAILKAIEFGELDKPKVKFLRQVLTKLLKETEPEDLINIFGRISGVPKLGMLREGLKLFISHFLLKNAQSLENAEQAKLLTERAEVATKAMEAREAKLKL
ncbi:nucleolar MIF4G domain-containing protein 1 [Engraulis encrasicolus]|uniref:nucleolar MIF4G domain-containing protein 1 n=1 Tax=Engraulis encrasicolus TaxID=184585 RepID=UPI002FCF5124